MSVCVWHMLKVWLFFLILNIIHNAPTYQQMSTHTHTHGMTGTFAQTWNQNPVKVSTVTNTTQFVKLLILLIVFLFKQIVDLHLNDWNDNVLFASPLCAYVCPSMTQIILFSFIALDFRSIFKPSCTNNVTHSLALFIPFRILLQVLDQLECDWRFYQFKFKLTQLETMLRFHFLCMHEKNHKHIASIWSCSDEH